jgi:hypothetical protein
MFLQNKNFFIQVRPNYTFVDTVFMNEVFFFKQFYTQDLYHYITITKDFLKKNEFPSKISLCSGTNMLIFPKSNELYWDGNKMLEESLKNMFKGTTTLKSVLELNTLISYHYEITVLNVVFDIYLSQLVETYKYFIYLNTIINTYI